ncbi:hypothetical protein L7F22_033121 [Adiantum nelumboides]|nr:hypothetical protein [Adiantum nelumboides]
MSLIDEHDGGDFKLFFLAYEHQNVAHRAQREGILELTWNKGTEKDDKLPTTMATTSRRLRPHCRLCRQPRESRASASRSSASASRRGPRTARCGPLRE